MSFFSYMKTGSFWRQIFWMLLIIAILIGAVLLSLRFFTRHGEDIKVADIRGMQIENLRAYEEEFGFRFVVRDSIYDPERQPGEIIAQLPQPGSTVKKNRTFYIVVAARMPSSVQMPDLKDLSLRQAEALLETYGLRVGAKITVPSIVKGAVIGQLYQGVEIEPGSLVRRGSYITLQIGDGKASLSIQQDTTEEEEFLDEDLEYPEDETESDV